MRDEAYLLQEVHSEELSYVDKSILTAKARDDVVPMVTTQQLPASPSFRWRVRLMPAICQARYGTFRMPQNRGSDFAPLNMTAEQ